MDLFSILLGYVIAVLFPVPLLSSAILSLWAAFGGKIMAAVKKLLPSKV